MNNKLFLTPAGSPRTSTATPRTATPRTATAYTGLVTPRPETLATDGPADRFHPSAPDRTPRLGRSDTARSLRRACVRARRVRARFAAATFAGLLGATTLGLGSGCSLQYNGAWGTGGPPRASSDEAEKRSGPRSTDETGFNGDRGSLSSASTGSRDEADFGQSAAATWKAPAARARQTRASGAGSRATFASNRDAGSASSRHVRSKRSDDYPGVGSMNIYGQIGRRRPAKTSPLDSPDNLARVTFTEDGADFDPEVDPTGTWLVYASTQHRETSDVYLKRVDGATVTQLTNDPAHDVMPTFSPDGKQIAFCSNRRGNWDLYLMDLSGSGKPVQLTNSSRNEIHPTFSPDGTRLAFSSYSSQAGQWEIAVIDLEKPQQPRFICNGLFPQWSPTEDRLLFQRARERGSRWFSVWTIDLVDGEGLRPTQIAASSNAAAITPTWSPDGQHIAFATVVNPEDPRQEEPVQADVWVVRRDGSGRANLTSSPFADLQPTWAADGAIYFVSNRAEEGFENVWAIRPSRAIDVAEVARTASARRTEQPPSWPITRSASSSNGPTGRSPAARHAGRSSERDSGVDASARRDSSISPPPNVNPSARASGDGEGQASSSGEFQMGQAPTERGQPQASGSGRTGETDESSSSRSEMTSVDEQELIVPIR